MFSQAKLIKIIDINYFAVCIIAFIFSSTSPAMHFSAGEFDKDSSIAFGGIIPIFVLPFSCQSEILQGRAIATAPQAVFPQNVPPRASPPQATAPVASPPRAQPPGGFGTSGRNF